MNLLNLKKLSAVLTVACSMAIVAPASAAPNLDWDLSTSFNVNSLSGTVLPGNDAGSDYKYDAGVESGLIELINALSTVISSDGLTAWVTWSPAGSVSIDEVILKAANAHIVWDTSGVDWSSYTGFYATQNLIAQGQGPRPSFNGISHVSVNGGTITRVPDSASTLLLIGLGLASVGFVARRRKT